MSDRFEQKMMDATRAAFTRSCEHVDAHTRAELSRRRAEALSGKRANAGEHWPRPLLPAGALATAMAIAGVLWLGPKPPGIDDAWSEVALQDARATADDTAASLDDDPEFFLWLASEPVADDEGDTSMSRSSKGQRP